MAELLRVDTSRETFILPADEAEAFALLQTRIGGDITFFPLANGGALVVDEDGIPRQLPLNALATDRVQQTVLGPAVLLDRAERQRVFG